VRAAPVPPAFSAWGFVTVFDAVSLLATPGATRPARMRLRLLGFRRSEEV